jgi:hypothetical protein
MTSNGIVEKLWNYCNILRDDGLSYQDYIEQLTRALRSSCHRFPRPILNICPSSDADAQFTVGHPETQLASNEKFCD